MADRDDMIRGLAALVAAVLAGDRAAARARGGDLASRLGLSGAGELGAAEAALLTALRFDPVGLIEIAAMTGDSPQSVNYLLGLPGAPEPVALARGKVWRESEVVPYFAGIDDRGPSGRRLARTEGRGGGVYIPRTEVRVGQVIAAGTVTAIDYSPSGNIIYFTCRGPDGVERKGKGLKKADRITVYPGPPGA